MGGALTQGTGTPWGAARYGQPTEPKQSEYITDPSKYRAFDTSYQANRALAGIGEDTARQQALTGAKLAQMGGGRSAGGARQMADIQAGAMNRAADIRNQMAQTSFGQQLAQMAAENQFNLQRQGLAQQQYATDAQLAAQEREGRRQALSSAFGPLGGVMNLFGNY